MIKFVKKRAIQLGTDAFVDAEISAEEAVLKATACLQVLMTQRRRGGFAPETGADALAMIGRGLACATEAFAHLAKAHPMLRQIPVEYMDEGDGDRQYGTSPTEGRLPPSLQVSDNEEATEIAASVRRAA